MASFESSKDFHEKRALVERFIADGKQADAPAAAKGKRKKELEKRDNTIPCTKKCLDLIRSRPEYRGVGLALIPIITGNSTINVTDVLLPLFPTEKVKLETQDLVKFFDKYHIQDRVPQVVFNAPKFLCEDAKAVQQLASTPCPFQLQILRVGVINDPKKGACVYVADARVVLKKLKKKKSKDSEEQPAEGSPELSPEPQEK